jgi:hypothetical protein
MIFLNNMALYNVFLCFHESEPSTYYCGFANENPN